MADSENIVQYEFMQGRDATEKIKAYPVGYLPIGCLERHGDHLPMGLDIIKAHRICCAAAKEIGGIVFPPHYYSGIHMMSKQNLAKYTGEWGNIYTDTSTKDNLIDIINQLALAGIKVLVLYSGHYPKCQTEMITEISREFEKQKSVKVIPFWENIVLQGDHAGISETSFMLYLGKDLVDMSRISAVNYRDHGWNDDNTPEKASSAKGEKDMKIVISYLKNKIDEACASLK